MADNVGKIPLYIQKEVSMPVFKFLICYQPSVPFQVPEVHALYSFVHASLLTKALIIIGLPWSTDHMELGIITHYANIACHCF